MQRAVMPILTVLKLQNKFHNLLQEIFCGLLLQYRL